MHTRAYAKRRFYVLATVPSLLKVALAALLAALSALAAADDGTEIAANRQWAEAAFSSTPGAPLPFSFVYGGQASKDIVGMWSRSLVDEVLNATTRRRTLTLTDPDTKLEVKAVAHIYTDSAGVDWTLYFTNKGTVDSAVIEQVRAVDVSDLCNVGAQVRVHRLKGSLSGADDWLPFDDTIASGGRLDFGTSNGLSSEACPFFNVDWGTGGVVTAIGWTGQWTASVVYSLSGSVGVSTGMQYMHLKLHPGESIRSPRILQVRWTGSDELASYNLFRHTMFKHIMPRIDGELVTPPIVHLGTAFYEMNSSTEQNTLSHLNAIEGLGFESYWLDAYWLKGDFPLGVGNWGFPISRAVAENRFPNGIAPIGSAAHAQGMSFVLWVQPETVCPGTALASEHPEWVIWPTDGIPALFGSGLFDLGIPQAREFATSYLTAIVAAYGIDCVRFDFFPSPVHLWLKNDSSDPDRQGITEIRYVEGLYRMWDDLLADPSKPFIDNCASGGRRIDLETCSRSIALWRTDATINPLFANDFDQASLQNQVMTAGLSRYVPFSTSGQMGVTPYQFRGGFNAGISFCEDVRSADYPKATLAQAIAEGKRIRRYYFGDFYPITPVTTSAADWCVMQYHLPDTHEGMVMAFRRSLASASARQCDLRGIDTQANYDVRLSYDYEQSPAVTVTGAQLAHLMIDVPEKPGSVIIEYKKNDSAGSGTASGVVRVAVPGGSPAPVANAIVRVVGAPIAMATGSDGSYTLSLAPGIYTIQCEKTGYSSVQAQVIIADGVAVVQDFELTTGVVVGKVTANGLAQQPIANATVQTSDGSSSAQTDSVGAYQLLVSPGDQTITASAPGYETSSAQITVPTSGTLVHDFSLNVRATDNVSDQFSLTNSPNGVWTYGWQQQLGGALIPYDNLSNPAAAISMWNMQGDAGAGIAGLVWKNTTAQPCDLWGWTEPGQVCLHPGPADQKAVVRWTARAGGRLRINAVFSGQNPSGDSADVRVLKNEASLYSSYVSGFAGRSSNNFADRFGANPIRTYKGETDVVAGDVIDFCVGYGGNGYSCDLTGLDASITRFSPFPTLAATRSAAGGSAVMIAEPLVVTMSTGTLSGGGIYVQDQNRVCGIKVIPASGQPALALGQRSCIMGMVGDVAGGEKAILDATFASIVNGAQPNPLAVTARTISLRIHDLSGLLTRVWGKVTYVASDLSFFYVDDGTGVQDGSGHLGLRIQPNGVTVPAANAYTGITGVVGMAVDGDTRVPVIRTRMASDLRLY